MKPEQQRIAIAEACGWTHTSEPCSHSSSVTEHYWWRPERKGLVMFDYKVCSQRMFPSGEIVGKSFPPELPDYLNDLNAMHEAEKILTDDQYHMQFLPYLGASAIHDSVCISRRCTSATAAQRAEAFLRTLNLWTES